jgi:hypothetical protein
MNEVEAKWDVNELKEQLHDALLRIRILEAQLNQRRQLEIALERIRQLENERDQWQRQAISNG